jgi:hypothetical protein
MLSFHNLCFTKTTKEREKKKERKKKLHVLLWVFYDLGQLQEIGLDLRN